jgi:hypothetical protein
MKLIIFQNTEYTIMDIQYLNKCKRCIYTVLQDGSMKDPVLLAAAGHPN